MKAFYLLFIFYYF